MASPMVVQANPMRTLSDASRRAAPAPVDTKRAAPRPAAITDSSPAATHRNSASPAAPAFPRSRAGTGGSAESLESRRLVAQVDSNVATVPRVESVASLGSTAARSFTTSSVDGEALPSAHGPATDRPRSASAGVGRSPSPAKAHLGSFSDVFGASDSVSMNPVHKNSNVDAGPVDMQAVAAKYGPKSAGNGGCSTALIRGPAWCSRISMGPITRFLRLKVSRKKRRYREDGFDLDLTYVTPRIIAMGYPSVGIEHFFRNPRNEVVNLLRTRHFAHHKVYNLCCEPGRTYPANTFHCM